MMKQQIKIAVFMICLFPFAPILSASAEEWNGSWIWCEEPGQTEVYFRKTVDLPADSTYARVVITADNRYTLYVNDTEVGKDNRWDSFEEYNIEEWLHEGKNVIGIRAGDDGSGAAGVLLDGIIRCGREFALAVATDQSWKVSIERRDGWLDPSFDDSDWKAPNVLGKVPMWPWGDHRRPRFFQSHGKVVGCEWSGPVTPEKPAELILRLRLREAIAAKGKAILRFFINGSESHRQEIGPDPPLDEWPVGKEFPAQFKGIVLPIHIPRYWHDVRLDIQDLVVEGGARVWPGDRLPGPAKVESRVESREIYGDLLRISAELKTNQKIQAPVHLCVALFSDEELWYAESVPSSHPGTWLADGQYDEQIEIRLPPLPMGSYDLQLGVHRAVSTMKEPVAVEVASLWGTPERPFGYGTFVDKFEVPHFWYIDRNGTVIWDGEPFIPVGGMYLPRFNTETGGDWLRDVDLLSDLRRRGVRDIYFNPCIDPRSRPTWAWQSLLDAAEAAGITYCWDFPMHLGALRAYHIEAGDFLSTVTESGEARVHIPSTWFGRTDPNNRVIAAVFDPETDALISHALATVSGPGGDDGIGVSTFVEVPAGAARVVHFVPELTFRGDMHDYWTDVDDQYYLGVQRMLSQIHPGPGFRGFIDPLDNEQSFRDQQRMLPACNAFRNQCAIWLAKRYGTIEKLAKAWGIDPVPTYFDEAAGLVPLGKASMDSDFGWALAWDTQRAFRVDLTRSTLWDDLLRFRDESIRDFNNQAADAVKAAVDAPVLMKLTELNGFTNNQAIGGFDALGFEAYGDAPELVRGCGGGVYSRGAQAARTMWVLVTETGFARKDIAPIGYPDPLRLMTELGSQVRMAAKGTYYFVLVPGGGWDIFNLYLDQRQIGWLGAFSEVMKNGAEGLAAYRPMVDFSCPLKQVGPKGFRRAETDYDGNAAHVSTPTSEGRWVVPCGVLPNIDVQGSGGRMVVNMSRPPATLMYGDALEEIQERGWPLIFVGLRHDLGALSVDQYYTDQFAADADGRTVQILNPPGEAVITHQTPDGKPFGFQLGDDLIIIAKEGWDFVIRSLDGKPLTAGEPEFIEEILGADILDLGPSFQGIRTGENTFVWNLADKETAIQASSKSAIEMSRDFESMEQIGTVLDLTLAANAGETIRLLCNEPIEFQGLDEGNLYFALEAHKDLVARAATAEMELPPRPEGEDWRPIWTFVQEWDQRVSDRINTIDVSRIAVVTLDGDLSDWAEIPETQITRKMGKDFVEDIQPLPNTGFRIAYNDSGLYFAVRAKDSHIINNHRGEGLWNGDAAEFFMETILEPGRTDRVYDADTYHFIFAPTSADGVPAVSVLGNPNLPEGYAPPTVDMVAGKTEDGWTLEVFFPPEALFGWKPQAGDIIGFNFTLGDSDGGDRDHAYPWRHTLGMSWTRFQFGRARFLE